jgi:hypothetical protein
MSGLFPMNQGSIDAGRRTNARDGITARRRLRQRGNLSQRPLQRRRLLQRMPRARAARAREKASLIWR